MQFHYRLIVHQRSLNFHISYNGFNLTVFDGLSNNNEITWNLNSHQSKGRKHIYKFFFFLRIFLYLFRDLCQSCQNNSLSTDPFSKKKKRQFCIDLVTWEYKFPLYINPWLPIEMIIQHVAVYIHSELLSSWPTHPVQTENW
jgi:hypothetical protein